MEQKVSILKRGQGRNWGDSEIEMRRTEAERDREKSDKTVTNLDFTTKDNVTRDSFKNI